MVREYEIVRDREGETMRLCFFNSWICIKFQCWVTCESSIIKRNLLFPYPYHLLLIYLDTEATKYIRLFEVQVGVAIQWDKFSFKFYLHQRYTYSFYPIISHGRYTFEIEDSDHVTHFIRDKVMVESIISSYRMLYIIFALSQLEFIRLKIRALHF